MSTPESSFPWPNEDKMRELSLKARELQRVVDEMESQRLQMDAFTAVLRINNTSSALGELLRQSDEMRRALEGIEEIIEVDSSIPERLRTSVGGIVEKAAATRKLIEQQLELATASGGATRRRTAIEALEDEDIVALAHKAGEAFFTPSEAAEAMVGQALLRRSRMHDVEDRYGLLKSEQVARLSGSEAKNTAQIAHRWQKQGRIFAVPVQGAPRFPGFQFDETGQPRPVIAEILKTLQLSDRGWAVAFWFDSPHASIPGHKSPAEVLAESPEQALEAAMATRNRAEDWA